MNNYKVLKDIEVEDLPFKDFFNIMLLNDGEGWCL